MKVFVLICESIYDMCDETISCAVFDTKGKAVAQMRTEYENAQKEWDGDSYIHEISETGAIHYPDGEFTSTHVQWEIFEKEIY